jgi:signal transduction histidine kinase
MQSMHERADAIEAILVIEPATPGTSLRVMLPIS